MTDAPRIPNQIALDKLRRKRLMPTDLSTIELRTVKKAIRDRSLFSARTTNAIYLQALKTGLADLLRGETNEATVRARLQDELDALDYDPEKGGFPGDTTVPPADRGTLRDLSSNKRVKLVLDTNERQVANYAYVKSGQSDLIRWQYPCWELVRIYPREHPRGTMGDIGWAERWVRAGGKLVGEARMIARKDDPLWVTLGSSDLFPDALDTPYPPFAFNSGKGIREVPREECIALGVISPNEIPDIQDPELNAQLKADADQFDPDILDALERDMKVLEGELLAA